jgi:hypothetical protein
MGSDVCPYDEDGLHKSGVRGKFMTDKELKKV